MDKVKLLEWLREHLEHAQNMQDEFHILTYENSYCAGLVDATKSIIEHIESEDV